MKLSPREAEGYFNRPDADRAGLLIYGNDAMRVALRRQQVIKALLGPQAEEEMRLTRMDGADLRSDPAALLDAVKAVGFFPGTRGVHVESAGEAAVPAIASALESWQPGDAAIIVTAGALKASSKLRKLFESHPTAYATGIYDDPPSRAEVERMLQSSGVGTVSGDGMDALFSLSLELGPGDFAQLVEKLALYTYGSHDPVEAEDVQAVAPRSTEAGVDDLLNIVAEARADQIGPVLRRLQSQGTAPTTLCIMATRHFRTLYAAASDPGGPAAGAGRIRPPLFGKRRDQVVRQAQAWGADRLEAALTLLTETDLTLRSAGQTAPPMAVMERALIRLAMLNGRRR